VIEVSEVVKNAFDLPFNSEVVVVLHWGVFSYLKEFWFVIFIRHAFHLCISLEPTALRDTKYQKDSLVFF
jgi:hypothetical protein